MNKPENMEVARITRWLCTESIAWNIISWEGNTKCQLNDVMEMLDRMMAHEMYQFAFLVLAWMNCDLQIHNILTDIICGWITGMHTSEHPLTDCIEALKHGIDKQDLWTKEIVI